jgi:hypothetical protein
MFLCAGAGIDDGVGVGLRTGIDEDDAFVFFCHHAHDGNPPILVDGRWRGAGLA